MKARKWITLASVVTLAGVTSVGFADETTTTPTTPPSTEVVTPVDPVPTEPTTPATPTTPTEPTTPVEPPVDTTPVEPTDPVPTDPTTPTEPTTPTDPSTPGSSTDPSTPGSSTNPTTPGNTTNPGTGTTPTNPSTGETPVTPTPEKPIVTEDGHEIVGVQGDKVVVKSTNGYSAVDPQEVGGKINDDGTLEVKDEKGEVKKLPKTGTKENIFLIVFSSLLLLFGFTLTRKETMTVNAEHFSF